MNIYDEYPLPWKVGDIYQDYAVVDAKGKIVLTAAHGKREISEHIVRIANLAYNHSKPDDDFGSSPTPWVVNGHSIESLDKGLWIQNEKTGRGVVATLPSCPKSRMSKKNRDTWDAVVENNAKLIVETINALFGSHNVKEK